MKTFSQIIGSFLLIAFVASQAMAQMPQLAQIKQVEVIEVKGKAMVTWSNIQYKDVDYFIVEKLDEHWEYVKLGEVQGSPVIINYSIEDNQPAEGENYYRITVVLQSGDQLLSDVLIADYFDKNPTFQLLPNGDHVCRYASLEKQFGDSDLFHKSKYNSFNLMTARLKTTSNIYGTTGNTKRLASLSD